MHMCLHIDYVHGGILKLAGCGLGKCGKCAQNATRCAVNSNCADDIQLKAVQIRKELFKTMKLFKVCTQFHTLHPKYTLTDTYPV